MHFCPNCGNLLLIERGLETMRFCCPTCVYNYDITRAYVSEVQLKHKKIDEDVFGGEEAWKNADRTQATCPRCGHQEAYYMQIQTRSADEPMTIFYRCAECKEHYKGD
jgi:DNA-directed RNA polymerase III subunit RPC11